MTAGNAHGKQTRFVEVSHRFHRHFARLVNRRGAFRQFGCRHLSTFNELTVGFNDDFLPPFLVLDHIAPLE